jgi:long-subunit acyl-CoA synthetase (AMP-forming)
MNMNGDPELTAKTIDQAGWITTSDVGYQDDDG